MRKLVLIFFMCVFVGLNVKAARIITIFDIAHWYLESDLVLICDVYQIDTLNLYSLDTLMDEGIHISFDMIKEVYYINTDSIIKSSSNESKIIDTIFSQDFSINYSKTKPGDDEVIYKVNSQGDTIATDTLKSIIMFGNDYSDNSYFRLGFENKYLVILSMTPNGYVIDYKSNLSDSILMLIKDVHDKGQAYFDDY